MLLWKPAVQSLSLSHTDYRRRNQNRVLGVGVMITSPDGEWVQPADNGEGGVALLEGPVVRGYLKAQSMATSLLVTKSFITPSFTFIRLAVASFTTIHSCSKDTT